MKWAIFDLDGTLAECKYRESFALSKDWETFHSLCVHDTPRRAEVELARVWVRAGGRIAIVTGRTEPHRSVTMEWLDRNGIPWHYLEMRQVGDRRSSEDVKRDWYERFREWKPDADIVFAVEDRDKMVTFWRGLGITTFQCQPGGY